MKTSITSLAAIVTLVTPLTLSLWCGGAAAQYPEWNLTAVAPFAAGSSNDAVARRVAPHPAKALGQQIIIENRPGTDGRIGIEAVAKATPDGYTRQYLADLAMRKDVVTRATIPMMD